ncbi:MAG: TIGR02221 family CRISPR-associated protein [Bacteroides sp.]|nr:TIGR02221 family CRISPR-associated protein [Bacteroides sp.]
MSRKVFISVLGTGIYEKCRYVKEDFSSSDTHFIQHATLEYLLGQENQWESTDTAIILLTDKARTCNWEHSIETRLRNGQPVEYTGLEKVLKQASLPFEVQTVRIPDGKNEEEMWEIFSLLFDQLQDDDRLYFDLTHSFRYLPMLVLVLGNYTKFLKNAKVCHISYGNYEARNTHTNEAPIVDILPLSLLQDWTFAAADYLENGNAKRLTDLCLSVVKPVVAETKGRDPMAKSLECFAKNLNRVIEERQTCRGISIVEAQSVRRLKENIRNISSGDLNIKPLKPVFEKISSSLDNFNEKENVENGFAAARWCLDNGLHQQAITIFHENILTYICKQKDLDWKNQAHRSMAASTLHIRANGTKETEWKVNGKIASEAEKQIIRKIIGSIPDIERLYHQMSELRNDINHSGIRPNPREANRIESSARKLMEEILVKLQAK